MSARPAVHRAAGWSAIVAGTAGVAFFATELAPPLLGFADTDDAVVMLRFLEQHPLPYLLGGVLLLVLAGALIAAALGVSDAIAADSPTLATRSLTVVGCVAAAGFALQGVLRLGRGPLLHIAGLGDGAGIAGYTAVQLLGVQGALQLALLALSCWALGIAIVGARRRTLPLWVCVLGFLPALRVLVVAGPFLALLPEDSVPPWLWLGAIASIPAAFLWCGLLGIALLARPRDRVS